MSLTLEKVTVSRGGQMILSSASLTVAAGEVVGITAPSGAGKTTMLSVASLLHLPDSGNVVISGTVVSAGTNKSKIPARLRQNIGLLPQNPRNYADPRLSLAETICTPLSFRDGRSRPHQKRYRDHVLQLCAEAQLPETLLERRPAEVSDGQLQRALLARAISLDPKVLLCDEPTSALDPKTTGAVFEVLRARASRGAAVIIASHDLSSLANTCDEVLALDQLQRR